MKCSEELPKLSEWGFSSMCLLWGLQESADHEESIFMGCLMKTDKEFYGRLGKCFKVTHWQPIPAPPNDD
ncbi:TPA: DUF551 domain-containing protein [Pasteurella multocida]|uniref:DUF551 domain-containing protein n=1 Tax=Pasteurella multocida TaxID=747 RepID=UPI0016ADD1EE|nr:hypothetical protein [Pasteurella multocida]